LWRPRGAVDYWSKQKPGVRGLAISEIFNIVLFGLAGETSVLPEKGGKESCRVCRIV
jgi:hypothetical protein